RDRSGLVPGFQVAERRFGRDVLVNKNSWRLFMKCIFGLFSLVFFATSVFAQQSAAKSPVSSAVREILPRQQKKLTEAVEEMPPDKFSYKPTPQQMSFSHWVMHITQSNIYLCAKISDTPAPKQQRSEERRVGKESKSQ